MNGPGYQYAGEFDPKLKHTKGGLLSAWRTRARTPNGSQFFLTFVATPWLDGKHTIFGEITAGMDNAEEAGREGHAERQDDRAAQDREATIEVG